MAVEGLAGTSAAVCGLLEAATHTVLFLRGVYPPALFERRLKYGVPVRLCRHPGVQEYVSRVVRAVDGALRGGDDVSRVIVAVVRAGDERPLERFVFEIGLLGALGDSLPDLERGLSSFLVRLNAAGAALGAPDPAVERSFRVLMHLREPPGGAGAEPLQTEWVPCAGGQTMRIDAPRIVPLGELDCEQALIQLFAEAGGACV